MFLGDEGEMMISLEIRYFLECKTMGNGLSVGLNDDLHWREVRETEGGLS